MIIQRCLVMLVTASLALPLGAADPPRARNVLVLTGDDLGRQLGCYGDHTVATPHIDALADRGTRFTNAHVAQPSCSPSRSAFLTGLYPHQNGQMGLVNRGFNMSRDWPVLPLLLQGARRSAAFIGKLHIGPPSACAERLDLFSNDGGAEPTRDHAVLRTRVKTYLASLKGKSFSLQCDLFDPHQEFRDQVNGLPEKPLVAGSVPPWSWTEVPSTRNNKDITAAEMPHSYYNCVARFDALVGVVLEELTRAGHRDDTLVIVWGDNGPPTPRGKTTLYDNGTHVPFIISGPGVRAGQVRDELVSMIDVLPTVCAATGVPAPQGEAYQGRDLGPLLRGETAVEWRTVLFTEMTFHTDDNFRPQRAATDGRWKLIRTLAADPAASTEELYDLTADPDERRDLAQVAQHLSERTRLSQAIQDWQRATKDPLLDPATFSRLAAIASAGRQSVPPWYVPDRRQ